VSLRRVCPILRPLLLPAAALALAACGGGPKRTPLVLYSPHGRDLLTLVEKAYEKEHPEIDVRWLDMGSQEVYDRVRSEAANPQADVWFGGPQEVFAHGAADGLLAPYRPSWAAALPPESRNPQDLYFGVYRTAPVLVYNAKAVPDAVAPHDWDDLLDPRWKGKILIRDPLASGTMRTLFGMILARSVDETGDTRRGFDWLRRLDAQTKEYVLNPALLMTQIERQEGLLTVWELTDILWQRKRGSSLAFHFARSGSPVIDDAIGLVKGAPHAKEARAFIEWVGSPAGVALAAEGAFRLPARTDVPPGELPPWARDVLRELKPAQVDWKLIAKHGQEWMTTWDRTVRAGGRSGT
jgi:iron(III) transport system substrate-binding protein